MHTLQVPEEATIQLRASWNSQTIWSGRAKKKMVCTERAQNITREMFQLRQLD